MLKLLDDEFACPQHNNANRGACPPSFIAFNFVGWNEGLPLRSGKGIVSFFNEVDILKELSSLLTVFAVLDRKSKTEG